ncbi:MAG: ATP-binding protein, partial [Bacteroidota bacterium]
MKTKDLLSHLSDLESMLSDFSFEELTADEASTLKNSFLNFKNNLEDKVFGVSTPVATPKETDLTYNVDREPGEKGSLLVAHVSHEIRTPLNGIIGFTDLLKESALSSDQLGHVNAIQSASHTLLDIINELLEYSKLSAGLESFETVNFNFQSIIKDVLYLCNTLIMEKNVKLEIDMDPHIPQVLVGDPSKLSQVLLNLLGNAIKFVKQGNISLKIVLSERSDSDVLIEFDVTDTGIGIAKDKLAHIFDSYKQAESDTYSKYGGTGLGLSIVKQIVERLNGTISVFSSLGVGTTFKFTLPYEIGTGMELNATEKDIADHKNALHLVEGMRILVFEDNLLNQRLMEQRLNAWGCRAYITDNAMYGLKVLENTAIDVVLMDLRMPVMNGFQVTERIRAHKNQQIAQTPIIALTADFTIRDKEQCTEKGVNDYILKPYSPDELMLKLIRCKRTMDETYPMGSIIINPNANKNTKPIVDLLPILDDCMGEMELLEELVRLYRQNALEFIGNVKLHLANNDIEALKFATHKLKSGLAMMNTPGLAEIVEQMHEVCKMNKDIKHLKFLYSFF